MTRLGLTSLLLMAASAFVGCDIESNRLTKRSSNMPTGIPTSDQGSDSQSVDQVKLFGETVYPILTKNCGASCHNKDQIPVFAREDLSASYQALIDSAKVDLKTPAQSRIYLRLQADHHNCWSDCAKDAEEMLKAIDAWAKNLPASTDPALPSLTTGAKTFPESLEKESSALTQGSRLVEAESGTLTGLWKALDRTGASSGKNIRALDEDFPIDITDIIKFPGTVEEATDLITYNFTLPVKGRFKLYLETLSGGEKADEIYYSVDDEPFRLMSVGTASSTNYSWLGENEAGQQQSGRVLGAGKHTVKLKRKEMVAGIDRVALSADPGFITADKGRGSSNKVKILEYDLEAACGVPGASLTVQIAEHNAQGWLLRRPQITTAQGGLRVERLEVLVNGVFNAANATYRVVNLDIPPESVGATLSSASMIVLADKDFQTDTISFQFGKCEPLP